MSGKVHPKCGAKKRMSEGTCGMHAGWGTDHVGYGRCKRHGGNTVTHRMAAAAQIEEEARRDTPYEDLIKRADLGDLIKELKKRSDITDITEELAVARAVTLSFIERADEMERALLRWSASFEPTFRETLYLHLAELADAKASEDWERYAELLEQKPDPLAFVERPKKVVDMANAVKMLRDVVAIADKALERRDAGAIPVRDLERALGEIVGVTEGAIRENIGDVALRAAILTAIEHGWSSITLGRGETVDDGAAAVPSRLAN